MATKKSTAETMAWRAALQDVRAVLEENGMTPNKMKSVGVSIFGTEMASDLYIAPTVTFPKGLIVESRFQADTGSADEKLAYLWLNIAESRYIAPVILVLNGGGHRGGAVKWIESKEDGERLIGVVTLKELGQWLSHTIQHH